MKTRIKVVTKGGVKRYISQYRKKWWNFWVDSCTYDWIDMAKEDIQQIIRREERSKNDRVEYINYPESE